MNDDQSIQLLQRWQAGDQQAANEIFDRYLLRLMSLARQRLSGKLQRRVDAEDIVQSAYRSFFRVSLDNDRIVLQRSGDLWRLLAGITIKKLQGQFEFHQAKKRAISNEGSVILSASSARLAPEAVSREPSIEEVFSFSEELENLMRTIEPVHRQILELRLQGESMEAISRQVERSERTVRRVLKDVTEALTERLEQQD